MIILSFCLLLDLTKTHAQTDTDSLTLLTDVQSAIALTVSSNTYDFGNISAGTPKKGSAGITAGVTTNAGNGYDLSVSDAIAGNDSCMLHTDAVTRIIDYTSTIAAPSIWNDGASKGVGLTVFSADTSKEAKWGTGTTFNDAFNKYAGVPQAATAIHNSPAYKVGEDHTDLAFAVDVAPDQKSGIYSGDVTLTVTANL